TGPEARPLFSQWMKESGKELRQTIQSWSEKHTRYQARRARIAEERQKIREEQRATQSRQPAAQPPAVAPRGAPGVPVSSPSPAPVRVPAARPLTVEEPLSSFTALI